MKQIVDGILEKCKGEKEIFQPHKTIINYLYRGITMGCTVAAIYCAWRKPISACVFILIAHMSNKLSKS